MPTSDGFLLAGVMGWPVMHSRSPKIHNYWLAELGLAGAYVPLAIRPEGLEAALCALPALGFAGCNLTIPHKEAALAIVDHVDPLARRIGAINLVVVGADGALTGRNTDGFGYVESILEAAPDWRADAGPIMVIGAGFGACFMGIRAGHGYELPTVWERVMPFIAVVGGALGGIATELLVRWGQRD